MAVRNGMTELISQFRSYVQESGTAIFTDDRVQQLLDNNSSYFYEDYLQRVPTKLNGSITYFEYLSSYQYLEGTASNTVRIYNGNGTAVSNYSSDFINGKFKFTTDTRGTAYYMDGRSFNFFKAVSEGWKEKASYYSTQFDFEVEGRKYKKSQVVKQCLDMAKEFDAKASAVMHSIDRGDLC